MPHDPLHRDGPKIVLTHEVPVSSEVAFHAWAEPEEYRAWAGTPDHLWKPAKDALWFFSVEHGGRTHPHYGRFVMIEPPHRLAYTWMSGGTKGADTLVTVEFKQLARTRAEVVLTHAGFPDEASAKAHEAGWKGNLERFAAYLAKTKH